MASGWGAVGGSAWGGGGAGAPVDDDDVIARAPAPAPPKEASATTSHAASGSAYNNSSSNPTYAAPPPGPDLASNSFRAQQPAAGGFGSSNGAYGNANAGSAQSFSAQAAASVGPGPNEAALKRKEAELIAKEKQLKELEKKLVDTGALKKKNWPFCYPILYHNIAGEVPEGSRRIVREGYMAWFGLLICLSWNLFCNCVILGTKQKQKVPSWFLALLYFVLGVPLSFWLWYLRLYNGCKQDSTLGFLGFFIWFAVHTCFCIWAAIAVPFSANQWSFAGFVTAINAMDVTDFVGVIYFVGAACWTVEALFSLWVIKDVFLFFRGQGGIQQAKQQAAIMALRSQISQQGSARV